MQSLKNFIFVSTVDSGVIEFDSPFERSYDSRVVEALYVLKTLALRSGIKVFRKSFNFPGLILVKRSSVGSFGTIAPFKGLF